MAVAALSEHAAHAAGAGPVAEAPALDLDRVTKSFERRPERPPMRLPLVRRWAGAPRGAPRPGRRVLAVDVVSLCVARGEIFGVLGANGSGKSTLEADGGDPR